MYKSRINISTENKKQLINKLNIFLKANKFIYCKGLKRKIDLSKLPDIIINRKKSATARLKRFFVAIDILRGEKTLKKRLENNCYEYEIVGLDGNETKVYIHIREENNNRKDKILYFFLAIKKILPLALRNDFYEFFRLEGSITCKRTP